MLKNERYNELVLEVDDSEKVMAELKRVTGQTLKEQPRQHVGATLNAENIIPK